MVQALHASGEYSICYIEAGAYQTRFPDDADFAPADYGGGASQYALQGFSGEWWLDISGFANYAAGDSSTLTGAAADIAAGLDKRIGWCALEGHDAVEPDDTDGYTNPGGTGVAGGVWQLTQADSAGFERWLANDAHGHDAPGRHRLHGYGRDRSVAARRQPARRQATAPRSDRQADQDQAAVADRDRQAGAPAQGLPRLVVGFSDLLLRPPIRTRGGDTPPPARR